MSHCCDKMECDKHWHGILEFPWLYMLYPKISTICVRTLILKLYNYLDTYSANFGAWHVPWHNLYKYYGDTLTCIVQYVQIGIVCVPPFLGIYPWGKQRLGHVGSNKRFGWLAKRSTNVLDMFSHVNWEGQPTMIGWLHMSTHHYSLDALWTCWDRLIAKLA